MTTRCETCPLQSFCAEIIETDTAKVTRHKQLLVELRLKLVDIDSLDAKASAVGDTYLDELEHQSAGDNEDIANVMEEYLRRTDHGKEIRQQVEELRERAGILVGAALYSLERFEDRLALGKQLQAVVTNGCERGPTDAQCNAPGAGQLMVKLGNVALPLPPYPNEAA